jgi:putative spermidine/putrescine transport system permease protein
MDVVKTSRSRMISRPSVGMLGGLGFVLAFFVFLFGPLLVLLLWSIAKNWFWPSALPTAFSFDFYRFALNVPGVLASLRTSLLVALIVVLTTTVLSIPAAYGIARIAFAGKAVMRTLFALPLMVPYIAIGIGVATAFYRLKLVGTLPGVVLAHTIATLPFGVLILTAALEALERSVEEAAAICGAGVWRRFFTITLPLIAPAILAQAIYVFTISMDEFTLTLLVSSADTATLPVRIFGAITEGYIQISSALAIMLLIPSLLLIFVMVRYLKAEYLTVGGV